ncbi:helix-turn-helix domain-containing protein [Shewanella saliphila]|uniref:HTH araC/xylS-type domain-containing protein n=1 Tax=Shewanella saliphila TaxID=2282698 RepID=A0ABQ2Q7F8_9GAMM|nr:AraC family transcriptional regulator [Shewanella saliphila]MCL1101850.1 AraC family transcriptional regulator [Shewanella saliphila]GGP59392.1 hypothetical protein GCM10009409_26530 [Shewanella saliphila]
MFSHNIEISSNALGRKLLNINHVSHQSCSNKHEILAIGKLNFCHLPNGIQIHTCDVIENQQATSSVELLPSLHINILFDGQVRFSLGQHSYHFESNKLNSPLETSKANGSPCVVFFNLLNRPELFTRHLHKQQRVKKLSISIDKSWLLERCQNKQDIQNIEQIFSNKNQVLQLMHTSMWFESAQKMMNYKTTSSMLEKLEFEQNAWKLIHLSLSELETKSDVKILSSEPAPLTVKPCYSQPAVNHFEVIFEQQLANGSINDKVSLKTLSVLMGVSISSLQRHFKVKYNMTAKEYIRKKCLEKAKKDIIINKLAIGEVAFSAGYTHVSSFITAFKKHFGITPAELRKQHFG